MFETMNHMPPKEQQDRVSRWGQLKLIQQKTAHKYGTTPHTNIVQHTPPM